MDVAVASKVGHVLTRSLGGLSLAEGSMLLRLRRASIALLALVGAVGLGLVFFISQIGWPGVLSGPLPGTPTRVGTVHDAIALTHSGPATATSRPAIGAGRGAGNAVHRGRNSSGGSQVGHSKQLGDGAAVHPGHGTDQPGSSQPAPYPEPVTPSPTPSATPTVASSPAPSASEPVKTSSGSKTSEAAVAKAVSDNSRSAAATATKSQGQKSTKDQGSSSGSTKSNEASSAKAKRDESVAKTKAKAPSAPAPAPEKSTPAPSPAAAKEAGDAAKANQAAH
jgi:hypothetical protein